MSLNIPENWTELNIGQLMDKLQYGYTAKASDDISKTRFLRITDIQNGTVEWSIVPGCEISNEDFEKYKLENGDFVFARTGSIEKAWMVHDAPKAVFASYLIRGKPLISDISPWLEQFIQSLNYLKQIGAVGLGIGRKNVNAQNLSKIRFPLPPLNEQKRIVAKIEALQTRSTAVKEELEAIKPLLDQFRQSVLAAAFRGDLTKDWREQNPNKVNNKISKLQSPVVIGESKGTIPDTWKWSLLTEIAKLESGHTPRKSVPEYWEGGDVPWICLKDIRAAHGQVIENTLHMPTMLGIENSSARLLPKGTVCFSRDISVGFVTIMGRSMATTQHFANWICSNQLFNKYLMYAFMASRYSLIQSGEGTTVRTIYMPALKKMRVVLPPLEEQQEIVRRIESLFKLADSIGQQYQQAEVDLETLNQSILAKAFRGELVPQDPNDEPASVLLERIREERDKQKTTAKKSKGKKKRNSNKQNQQLDIPGM